MEYPYFIYKSCSLKLSYLLLIHMFTICLFHEILQIHPWDKKYRASIVYFQTFVSMNFVSQTTEF